MTTIHNPRACMGSAYIDDDDAHERSNSSVSMPRWQWKALGRLAWEQGKSRSRLIAETTLPLVEAAEPKGGHP